MKYFCGAKNLGGRLSAWGTDLLRACCPPPAATIPPAAGNIDFRTFGVGHRPQAVPTRKSPDDTPMSDTQWRSRLPPPLSFVSLNPVRSGDHTSELQSLMRTSYAVLCL